MIRGPFTRGPATIRILGKTLSPVVTIPLLHAGEPPPDGVNRMLRVRAKISKFPGEHRGATCSIDDPVRANSALASIVDNGVDLLSACAVQLELRYLGGTPKITTGLHRQVQHV